MTENDKSVEMDVADAIMEKPIGFAIGSRSFFIYPPTLGKLYLIGRLLEALDINKEMIAVNAYLEAIRLCREKRNEVCRILAYSTFYRKYDLFNNRKIEKRIKLFSKKLSEEELATVFMLVLTGDNLDTFIEYFHLDKEADERKRISMIKKSDGVSFGGNSTYGTLIDFACQRYGWSMHYVVWGISYINLRMLMSDAVTTLYLSAEERKQLGIATSSETIDAGDPRNRALIKSLLKDPS